MNERRVVGRSFSFLFYITLGLVLISCSKKRTSDGNGVSPEPEYCSAVYSYSSPVTISGTAVYKRRSFHASSGLGDVEATNYPIRRAEVRVRNGSSTVQCGETDDSGSFSVLIPQSSSTHTVEVFSRANNSYVIVSILNDPTNNVPYSLSTTVTPDTSKNVGTLTASATGDVMGGAFNIYDQILKANEFMRTKTATCGALCTVFTVAPKAYVYWKIGLNPYSYYGGTTPLSFYIPGEDKLYILGGANGDFNNTDTDHFDNTVIIHEYGHFLEDNFSKTDNIGGHHDGDSIVDPRLAWGEGWANFFGVYVNAYFTGDTYYRDTKGNTSGTTFSYLIKYELDDNPASTDIPSAAGEGNFREFSIARTLYDSVDKNTDGPGGTTDTNFENDESIEASFHEFWAILSVYFPQSTYHFRNFGLFMELQDTLSGRTDLSSLLTIENQRKDRQDFARPVSAPNGTCNYTMTAVSPFSSYSQSNLLKNNDFFQYNHSGGSLTLTLNHQNTSDLDLFLYREDFRFGESGDMISASNSDTEATETISLGNLAAGTYMINVMTYTGSTPNTYTLSTAAGQLCP